MTNPPKQTNSIIDSFGRQISYVRVSLTDRCNLRCGYCYGTLKENSQEFNLLSSEEILRLLNALALVGVTKVRFTGGEPLVYPDLTELIANTSAIKNVSLIGVTTNGLLLEQMLPSLLKAGLSRLNISLDTLNPVTFKDLTGVDGFDRVMDGIQAAVESDAFGFVKINTVVMRSVNESELRRFAEYALARKIDLRLIEFMPTEGADWGRDRFVSEKEMKELISLDLIPIEYDKKTAGPARSFTVAGGIGRLSFISAVSRCFCSACNRVRITSDGRLVGCLFGNEAADLRGLLQQPYSDEELGQRIVSLVSESGFRRQSETQSISEVNPSMRSIGG